MMLAALVAVAALALVGALAWALHDSAEDRVTPHWRDAHHRERRNDDG